MSGRPSRRTVSRAVWDMRLWRRKTYELPTEMYLSRKSAIRPSATCKRLPAIPTYEPPTGARLGEGVPKEHMGCCKRMGVTQAQNCQIASRPYPNSNPTIHPRQLHSKGRATGGDEETQTSLHHLSNRNECPSRFIRPPRPLRIV